MKGKDEKIVKDLEPGLSSTDPTSIQSPVTRRGPTLIRPEDMEKYMKNPSLGFFSVAVKDEPEFNNDSFSSESDCDEFSSDARGLLAPQ
ncbi:hypothetical protein [uncultured Legionella sp.]|uniref:hypothetical protein n=1 Tax=uncultured Legionella sp. TaxID=210934 RepID=UPI00260D2804|nr:hypothetical protein [uncultured Legionella sp.]